MNLLLSILFLLLSAATVVTWLQLRQHRQQLQLANDQLNALTDPLTDNREPEMVITLKVIDPISLAKRESRSARLLADRLPIMISKMVYQQVMRELEEELKQRQIDAEMAIEYR